MSDFDLAVAGHVVLADRTILSGVVAVRVGEGAAPAAREQHDVGEAFVRLGKGAP